MSADPSKFHPINVTDTCSVWNVLSSNTLYLAARGAGCSFCITRFVQYELLDKPRKTEHAADNELKNRLRVEQAAGRFETHPCTIDDLLAVGVLEERKRLGKGELSSIAFALKINQGFLSDDQKAVTLAVQRGVVAAQTVPHLLSWLMFTHYLTDADAHAVVGEHKALNRSLENQLHDARETALLCLQNVPASKVP